MKKLLLLVLILLINLSFVNAEGVILKEENVQNTLEEGGSASFDLIVENDDRRERDIFITFPYTTDWRVNVNPYLLRIPSKSTKIAKIETFSLNDKNIGSFDIVLNVKSRDETIKEDFVYRVKVLPFSGDEILSQLVVPDRIDPRTGGNVKLKLENLRNINYGDLEVTVNSEDVFSEKRFLNLNVDEIKLEDFSFTFPEGLEPRRYNVEAEVKYGNKVIGKTSDSFVLASFSDVVERISREGSLFTKKLVISKINGGTIEKEETIIISVSKIKNLFTSFSREPDRFVEEDGGYIAEWDFILGSGDAFKVEIITNYIFIFWSIVVVLLVGILIAQLKRKRIVVSKRILDVRKDKEGISGMKVILHVKNKSRKNISDIRLLDTLPMLIGTSPHSFSTLQPTKVKKTSFGNIRLIWNLSELHGGEERIISYVARSRLSIIGKIILPSAVVIYKRGNKKVKSRSNKLTLLTAIKEEMS